MCVRVLLEIGQDGRVIEHADRPWGAYTVLAEAEDFKRPEQDSNLRPTA